MTFQMVVLTIMENHGRKKVRLQARHISWTRTRKVEDSGCEWKQCRRGDA